MKSLNESISRRHSRVDLGGVSTAISKAKTLWGSCISPAHPINRDESEIVSGAVFSTAIKLNHFWRSGVDQGGVLTAISKTKAYPAELYITSTVYQLRSANG